MSEPKVGLVSPSQQAKWLGGLYVVQHYFLNAAVLPAEERIAFHDVWWGSGPEGDPFAEIRAELGAPLVVRPPSTFAGRVRVGVRRRLHGRSFIADVFHESGVNVLFPVPLFDDRSLPFVYLLPDFQYRHLTGINDRQVFEYFENRHRHAAERARFIVMLSRAVFDDLRRFMPEFVPKARYVFPRAVPTPLWYERDPAEVAREYSLPERYFVISNQVSKHKNHVTVANAVKLLVQRGVDVNVVCTGLTDDYRDPDFFASLDREIASLALGSRFRFLGVVPRADQMAIMRGAIAVVQPSKFEGWGAAMAEAKSLGKPVIASDLPVHHEHGANVYRWIATRDAESWAEAMGDALRDLGPGPDRDAEALARTQALVEARESGRALVALFREAVAR